MYNFQLEFDWTLNVWPHVSAIKWVFKKYKKNQRSTSISHLYTYRFFFFFLVGTLRNVCLGLGKTEVTSLSSLHSESLAVVVVVFLAFSKRWTWLIYQKRERYASENPLARIRNPTAIVLQTKSINCYHSSTRNLTTHIIH